MCGERIRTAVFGVVVGLISVMGCATTRSDFVVALPNGYQIVRDRTSAPTIVKRSGGVVVPGPVASYAVVRDVVVGVVQPSAPAGKQARSAKKQADAVKPVADTSTASDMTAAEQKAYFVLNTRTGEVGKGLSESDYNERLKSLNIAPSPELSPPVLPK